jgi:3-oxoacyl-[acyl-carrier protein] reductase
MSEQPHPRARFPRGRRFDGSVVVVTGGGSGIGEAMCLAFAAEGARMAVLDLDAARADRVARASDGGVGIECDVGDAASVRSAFAAVDRALGAADVLVNNAGIADRREDVQERMLANVQAAAAGQPRQPLRALSTLEPELWHRMLRIHLDGTFYCCREALLRMEKRRRGVILNMGSVAGLAGLATAPHYSGAKGGIIALTRALAQDVAPAGIRVNAIAPGWTETPLTEAAVRPELAALITRQVPLGRWGRPEEIAALALHLASDEAAYTTGQVISPNGGIWF